VKRPAQNSVHLRVVVATRRDWVQLAGFELLLSLFAILAGIVLFLDPTALQRSAIGQAYRPWDQIWSGGYILAGALTSAGVLRVDRRLECAGLSLLAAAVSIAGLAAWSGVGLAGTVAALNYVATAVACVMRLRWLIGHRL